jgi:hypothetical protein
MHLVVTKATSQTSDKPESSFKSSRLVTVISRHLTHRPKSLAHNFFLNLLYLKHVEIIIIVMVHAKLFTFQVCVVPKFVFRSGSDTEQEVDEIYTI